jgi:hypothetical protein
MHLRIMCLLTRHKLCSWQGKVDAVIAKFEKEPVMEVYNTIKGFLCCDVFEEISAVRFARCIYSCLRYYCTDRQFLGTGIQKD